MAQDLQHAWGQKLVREAVEIGPVAGNQVPIKKDPGSTATYTQLAKIGANAVFAHLAGQHERAAGRGKELADRLRPGRAAAAELVEQGVLLLSPLPVGGAGSFELPNPVVGQAQALVVHDLGADVRHPAAA